MSEYVYRYEINLIEMADKYAKRLQERVDGMALDKAADTLERFGYVKVIRCRDCRHYSAKNEECFRFDPFTRSPILVGVDSNGFCAWAERRTE